MSVALLIHGANVLYLLSYLVRDILWLRSLTVVAICLLSPYFYFRPEPLWAAIGWNELFLSINLAQIRILLLERRPVKLTETEQRLYSLVFRSITPREFTKLLKLGTWQEASPDDTIVEAGEKLDHMLVIYEGKADVEVDGKSVAQLDDGSFVGEISYLTGQIPRARVRAAETTKYVQWPFAELKTFLKENPDLRSAWQMVLGTDLATKLRAA